MAQCMLNIYYWIKIQAGCDGFENRTCHAMFSSFSVKKKIDLLCNGEYLMQKARYFNRWGTGI